MPVTSAANQAPRAAKTTATDHSSSQTKWGIASNSLNTTVSRGRSRSSVTTVRTGCSGSCENGSIAAGSELG